MPRSVLMSGRVAGLPSQEKIRSRDGKRPVIIPARLDEHTGEQA